MAQSAFLPSEHADEEPLHQVQVQYVPASAGWTITFLLALAAAAVGFAIYVYAVPYGALRAELNRKTAQLAAERAAANEIRIQPVGPLSTPEPDAEALSFQANATALASRLRRELGPAGAEIVTDKQRVLVRLPEGAVYEGVGVDISEAGETTLRLLGNVLKTLKGSAFQAQVFVVAHLDSSPIPEDLNDIYPTAWELAAGRANSAVRFLEDEGQVPAGLLFAVSGGAHHPAPQGAKGARRLEVEIRALVSPSDG